MNPITCINHGLSLSIVLAAALTPHQAEAATLPFHGADTWTVCQGYNTSEIDHVDGESGRFALDLVTDANAAVGTYGCNPGIAGASAGKPILAPVAGVIRHSATNGGEFICLRLDSPFGRIRSINFGHLDPSRQGWTAGQFDTRVEAGEVLGTLRRILAPGYGPPHLHMAAYAQADRRGETVPFDDFFVGLNLPALYDASGNLKVHQHYGFAVRPTILPPSVVDGAGSLVDPANGGRCSAFQLNGCSRDLVRLHSHGVPSTAVFQVLGQRGSCDHVNVGGLDAAHILVKRWSETYPGAEGDGSSSIFLANRLPASLPIPSNTWMTISVTTTSPVPAGQTRTVSLACGSGSGSYARPADLAPPVTSRAANPQLLLLPLQGDFFWSGNASMVTFSANTANAAAAVGYGRTRDEAITLASRKSLAVFQFFAEGRICKTVELSDAAGVASRAVEVGSMPFRVELDRTSDAVSGPLTAPWPARRAMPASG
jgi:hypothetical protein